VVNSSKLILRALSIIAFEVSVGFELVEEDRITDELRM
jgi:hypothetical protein